MDHAEIRLTLYRPHLPEKSLAFQLRDNLERCLGQLPKDREIDPRSYAIAAEQMSQRDDLTRHIGRSFAGGLMKILQDSDTVNGYPNEAETKPVELNFTDLGSALALLILSHPWIVEAVQDLGPDGDLLLQKLKHFTRYRMMEPGPCEELNPYECVKSAAAAVPQ